MADYAAKPTKAKEDMGIIDLRKRMLGVFLNRCRKMREIREDGVWWRFLDPNASWVKILGVEEEKTPSLTISVRTKCSILTRSQLSQRISYKRLLLIPPIPLRPTNGC